MSLSSNTAGKKEDLASVGRKRQIHRGTIPPAHDEPFEGSEEGGWDVDWPAPAG